MAPVVEIVEGRPEVRVRVPLTADDIDALGHVNFTVYYDVLGCVRRLLVRVPYGEREPDLSERFVLARTELDYRREVLLEEGFMDASARVVRVGTKSLLVANELRRADGEVAAAGTAVMVAFDAVDRRSRPITAVERAAFGG